MKDILKFRQRLRSKELLIGACISLTDPFVTDCLASSVDFFWIDMEHSGMTVETVAGHLLAARSRGVPALVRVVASGSQFIKPVLDQGAEGIIVPQVRSAEEVARVVQDCRYPPAGLRGYGPRVPSNYGRMEGQVYVRSANQNIYVSVQIENQEALDALDEILATPGLDGVVLGPADLSGSLGVLGQIDAPRVVEAMQTVIRKARAAGLTVGAGAGPDVADGTTMARHGVHWMCVGTDVHYLWRYCDQTVLAVRKELEDAHRGLANTEPNIIDKSD